MKKEPAKKKASAACCSDVQDQIQALKQEMQGQIDALKSDLAAKDAELQQAKQAAADAQAAAAKAEADASALQSASSENTAAVATLQGSVKDLTANQASLTTTLSDETTNIKKMINSPDTLHYKGITITPGGFAAGETIWRAHATGADIPTPFNALPYEKADAYLLSEFYGSGRASRVSMLAEGKPSWGTLRGYFEGDWLGTSVTGNNNATNSYAFRDRLLWAQAQTNSGWSFLGGQVWSLTTEDRKGVSNLTSDIALPQEVDPNIHAGFVGARQWGFRVSKTWDKFAIAFAAENPQLIYSASLAGNEPYAVLGSAGSSGGAYNPAISSCSPSTSIVNYTNEAVPNSGTTATGGVTADAAVPVYKTVNSCANVSNYSFNYAPDLIVKLAFDPGWGHYEIIGIGGFAHETVYPGETTNSNLYGGIKDVAASAAAGATVDAAPALTSAGAYGNSINLGGVAASLRVPAGHVVSFGLKGLYGPGVGRYGYASTLTDVTANYNGELVPVHNTSALGTLEISPSNRFVLYLNGGIDYAARVDFANAGSTTLGAPSAIFCPTTAGAFACTSSPTTADVAAGGSWGATWKTPSEAAVGYGSRLLNNSACNTLAAPGYNGSSTGYYPGASCGAQNRDIQEYTAGYWYDIYRGDHGRFRQGIQYSYAERQGWSGAPATAGGAGIGAKGIENMFYTTLRYYLP